MGVVLGEKVLEGTHPAHQRKKIGVIEKENVQPHFDVIAVGVHPATHLAAHEGAGLIEVHCVTGVDEIHRSGQGGQTGSNDRDPHIRSATEETL